MMSCMQMASFRPQCSVKVSHHKSRVFPSVTHAFAVGIPNLPSRYPKLSTCAPIHRRQTIVCVFGGKGEQGGNNQDPPWKGIQDAFENVGKKLSVEDMIRKQIAKRRYESEEAGGGGGSPPGGGGDGGGDGGGSDDDDNDDIDNRIPNVRKPVEEESFAEKLDETVQMILASLGLIFTYVYILYGPEIKLLTADYIRYLRTGKKSRRLKYAMFYTYRFCKAMIGKGPKKENIESEDSMAKQLINTRTWYDGPKKHKKLMTEYMAERAGDPDVGVEEVDKYTQLWREKYNELKRKQEERRRRRREELVWGDSDDDEEGGYKGEGYREVYNENAYKEDDERSADDDYRY